MKLNMKLNNLLGLTEAFSKQIAAVVSAYNEFFKKDNGASFRGERKTYTAAVDTIDVPTNRYNNRVVSTITEKFEYLVSIIAPALGDQLSVEATNASGIKAELKVDGKSYGEFTSLELLRFKSFLNNPDLYNMLKTIPVRSDAKDWKESEGDYVGRGIFNTESQKYENTTTTKEEIILSDPNVAAAIANGKTINYSPQKVTLTKTQILGNGELTKYSGEWSHKDRAEVLSRLTELKKGVILALAEANEAEVVRTVLPVKELLEYLLVPTK